jgi:transposase
MFVPCGRAIDNILLLCNAEIIFWLSHKEMWDLAELAIHIESKYDVIYQSQLSLLLFIAFLKKMRYNNSSV